MYIKTFHYKLKPDVNEDFLALQKEIDSLYQRHVHYEIEFLQDDKDPTKWVEVHYYATRQDYQEGREKMNTLPEMKTLWDKFQTLLDPHHTEIEEEEFEETS
jgi:hypothetical protein